MLAIDFASPSFSMALDLVLALVARSLVACEVLFHRWLALLLIWQLRLRQHLDSLWRSVIILVLL